MGVGADPRRHRASLENLGVHFDVWKSEGSLHTEGWVTQGIEQLATPASMYEQDGAQWFRSTAYGDDKDRVVIRSNGEPTYFASRTSATWSRSSAAASTS